MANSIITAAIAEMLKITETVFSKHNIQYYLVGAVARDIHLSDYKSPRRTKDIDLAILIDNENQFYEVKNALLHTGHFKEHETEPIKLFYKNAIELDLLPFGKIENEKRETILTKPILFTMDVPGFKELMPHIQQIHIEGTTLNICPLEGIIILKIISYNQNPSRDKDLADIEHFISVYFDIHSEEIYNDHYDILNLYENNTEFQQLVSQRLIGRKIKRLLQHNPPMLNKIKEYCTDSSSSRITMLWPAIADGLED